MSTRPKGRTAELPKLILASFEDIMSTTEAKFINSGRNPQKNKKNYYYCKFRPEASVVDMKLKLILAKINFGGLAVQPGGLVDMLPF